MLLMLLPEQLDRFWSQIRFAIESSFTPDVLDGQNILNNVLESLLLGKMQAWFLTEDQDSINAILLTSITSDSAVAGNVLTLYLLYAFEPTKQDWWEDGWKTMERFAASRKCTRVDAFSTNPAVIKKAEEFGWKSEYHLYKEL